MSYTGRLLLVCLAHVCFGNQTAIISSPIAYMYSGMQTVMDKVAPECANFSFGYMEFYSPMYPEPYPNNMDCFHTIEAQPGYEIHLDFLGEKFAIEDSESGECKFDFLEVRYGPYAYSNPSQKLCGDKFPPLLVSPTRFMWLRFKSDDNEQKAGFRGVYSFIKKKKEEYDPDQENRNVCRHIVKTSTGLLTSSMMTSLTNGNVDCTWEIHAPSKSKIMISVKRLEFSNTDCSSRKIEIYDTTTRIEDRREELCEERTPHLLLNTNLVFIRVFAERLSFKPKVEIIYTILPPRGVGGCSSSDFVCDNSCVSNSLKCDGHRNCPNGEDEEGCPASAFNSSDEAGVPMYIIIGAAVGGVVVVGILITIIVMACNSCSHKKQKQKELEENKIKEKNIEMTSNSSSSKKAAPPSGYFSLPRPQGGRSGSFKDSIHRNSLTNSLQTPSEGEYGDQCSDPGTYKRFMTMDQYTTIEDENSPCPSLYNQAPILTTIVERHDIPPQTEIDGSFGWGGYGWKQSPGEPRSPSSLSENLAKLAKYNMPQKTFQYTGNPDMKLYYPEHKYDTVPDQRVLLNQDYKNKYLTPQEKDISPHDEHNLKKQFKLKSQHPDITRDLEVTS